MPAFSQVFLKRLSACSIRLVFLDLDDRHVFFLSPGNPRFETLWLWSRETVTRVPRPGLHSNAFVSGPMSGFVSNRLCIAFGIA